MMKNNIATSSDEGHSSTFDSVIDGTRTGVIVGAMWGAIHSAWEAKPVAGQNTGALLFQTARTISINAGKLGVLAAVFQASKSASREFRGKNDAVNSFIGGCIAGSFAGLKGGSVNRGIGGCLLVGSVAALAHIGTNRHVEKVDPMQHIQSFQKS
eukprot:m.49559 g.49559  ORF g.49559 m.49559 type:complete len:155 (-) comp7458_c0_seq1:4177-4641(-)